MALFSVRAESAQQIEKYIKLRSQSGDRGAWYGNTLYVTSAESGGAFSYYREIEKNNLFQLDKDIKAEKETALASGLGHIALGRKLDETRQFIDIRVPIKGEDKNRFFDISQTDHISRYYPVDEYFDEKELYEIPDDIALSVTARAIYDVIKGNRDEYTDDYNESGQAWVKQQQDMENFVKEMITKLSK